MCQPHIKRSPMNQSETYSSIEKRVSTNIYKNKKKKVQIAKMLNPPSLQVHVNHHRRSITNGLRSVGISSLLDELTSISTRSATQTLLFNTLGKNFFSLLSYRASRIGKVRGLLSLIILRVFAYLI